MPPKKSATKRKKDPQGGSKSKSDEKGFKRNHARSHVPGAVDVEGNEVPCPSDWSSEKYGTAVANLQTKVPEG